MAGLKLGFKLGVLSLRDKNGIYWFLPFEKRRVFTENYLNFKSMFIRSFSTEKKGEKIEKFITEEETEVKRKKPEVSKILLQDLKGNIKSMTIEEAQKIANKQKLELQKITSGGKKDLYKLLDVKAVLGNVRDKTKTKTKTKMKIFTIDIGVAEHDFQTKLNNIENVLNKGKNVLIELKNKNLVPIDLTNVVNKIETTFKDKCKINKVNTKTGVKFELIPVPKEQEECKKGS